MLRMDCKSLHPSSILGQASTSPLGEDLSGDPTPRNETDPNGAVRDHLSRPNPKPGSRVVPSRPEHLGFQLPPRLSFGAREDGVVYLMMSGDLLKIGSAGNLDRRLQALRCGNPLIKLAGYRSAPRMLIQQLERRLHRQFAAQRRDGEWFSLAADDVMPTLHQWALHSRMALQRFIDDGHISDEEPLPWGLKARIREVARRRARPA